MALGFHSRYVNGERFRVQRVVEFFKSQGSGLLMLFGHGTFLAILGPYNTAGLGWPWVWVYWTGLIGFGGLCGDGIVYVLNRVAPDLSKGVVYALVAVLVSFPVAAAVITIQGVFGPLPPAYVWPMIYGFVLVISAGVSGLTYLLERPDKASDAAMPGRALTDKLPVKYRTAGILALQSEDHYLRVHTDRGDALILMRLSDAMAAVENLEGAQTHRSWWVARAAIDHAEKSGGRAELTLSNGIQAPVSRGFYPDLRDKGWI
jgi:hypothetical protein